MSPAFPVAAPANRRGPGSSAGEKRLLKLIMEGTGFWCFVAGSTPTETPSSDLEARSKLKYDWIRFWMALTLREPGRLHACFTLLEI